MVSCWMLMWVDGFCRRRMPDYYVDVGEDPVRKSYQQDVGLVYIYGKGLDRKLLVSQAMNSVYEYANENYANRISTFDYRKEALILCCDC
ncbi:hypothetical protein L2E82_01308 [Cichorium intybus]|uniref:Uncharacterized protein n=1 Tax=Cichorium intybus TaxID=13427 RepID=A0ACB9GYM4_CICIN|nr:hypothetical protein L2E82_01308 [Cichorium intybus]